MGRRFSFLLTATTVLGLTACSFVQGTSGIFNTFGCAHYPPQTIGAANWDTAHSVNMRIRQGEYWPMVVTVQAKRPYVLRIANADDVNRVFRAGEFFNAVAVGLVRIDGEDYSHTCLSSITIGPGKTAEVWFVAERDGRYEFEDQTIPYLFSQGASGVIHVSYARPRLVSPVSGLLVPDPEAEPEPPAAAPPSPAPAESSSSSSSSPAPPAPPATPPPAVTTAPVENPAAPPTISPKAAPKAPAG